MSPKKTGVKSHLARKIHKNIIPFGSKVAPEATVARKPGDSIVIEPSSSITVFHDPVKDKKRLG
ncbi:hypothetical protein AB4Y89_02420 [Terriglobus sp. 2YAB30_2]|uniref:hypothetical protein n=1 Tax=unclassified Terriglobus TaxID=2628988 RepID=UPI003F9D5BC8